MPVMANWLRAGQQLESAVIADLASHGSLPTEFYPSLAQRDDPASGFVDHVSPPRFSHSYFQLRNRFGMLVETHSWKDYPTRVRITRHTVVSLLDQMAAHGKEWLKTAHEADLRSAALAGQWVPLDFATTPTARTVEFRGYEYTRTMSEISGALMTHYDESKPQVWKVPLRDEIVPGKSVVAPLAGYLVPAAYLQLVAEKLKIHDVKFRELAAPLKDAAVETFRATEITFARRSDEGHQSLTVNGALENGNTRL